MSLLTNRYYNREALKTTMKKVWQPVHEVRFKELGSKLLLVEFVDDRDKQRVLREGPWTFDRNLVLLKHLEVVGHQEAQVSSQLPFGSWLRAGTLLGRGEGKLCLKASYHRNSSSARSLKIDRQPTGVKPRKKETTEKVDGNQETFEREDFFSASVMQESRKDAVIGDNVECNVTGMLTSTVVTKKEIVQNYTGLHREEPLSFPSKEGINMFPAPKLLNEDGLQPIGNEVGVETHSKPRRGRPCRKWVRVCPTSHEVTGVSLLQEVKGKRKALGLNSTSSKRGRTSMMENEDDTALDLSPTVKATKQPRRDK
ncbi:hypothetical protein CIPAW_14G046500 [Carya illinoinensis]|uniref:DUF4283 domain-containing protein n=1 Tax=Carya illinoinensis TaxID=32201 RepID=A0A8T1NGJ9_CARIL|nr:hypothetical protein CIPAW_14G046500 [Carya illinoinensis]